MSFDDFFGHLIAAIEQARVDYMLVGSVASISHGESRSTRDADVVVALDQAGAERLIEAFPADTWYADLDMAREAVARRRSFHVIDEVTFWKADFIVRPDSPYDRVAFGRRMQKTVSGVLAWVATPEDTILGKLRWAIAGGGSARQLDDIAGILRIQGERIDRAYLEQWVPILGVEAAWRQVA
ncbi:MAG: hypothetical protein R3F60_00790 [bacterium]